MMDRLKRLMRFATAGLILWNVPATVVAQDFVNTGSVTNNGTFKVKRTVTGLPSSLGGTFEYYGTVQSVQPVNYTNLRLTGSAVKSAGSGNFAVNGLLEVAPAVTLALPKGNYITLGDSLQEFGTFIGGIQKTETLLSASQSTFGNIGSKIVTTTAAMGSTRVRRVSGDTLTASNGKQGILRYYDISPTLNTRLAATLTFSYAASELNGKDPSTLELWRYHSADSTWRRQGGAVDTAARTITKSGVISFSRWTASDAANLLGRPEYEWRPAALAESGGNNQLIKARDTSGVFIATVLDAYNNPIPNERVVFTVTGSPAGAIGQSMVQDTVSTDSAGQARARLVIGSKPGRYTVTAAASGTAGIQLHATAAVVTGDANNDFAMDVADITSIIAYLNGTMTLTADQLAYADINNDGAVNVKDIDSVRANILNGVVGFDTVGAAVPELHKQSAPQFSPSAATATIDSTLARVNVEITGKGIRVNMRNSRPISGFQLFIRFSGTVGIFNTDVVYDRSQHLQIAMKSIGQEFRLVGYNLNNTPVDTGSGSLFRLPLPFASMSVSDIESVYVVVSTDSGRSVQPLTTRTVAATNQYPSTFAVYQNYPNPFNGGTKIEYDIPDVEGKLKIAYLFIYDVLGRKVKTLASGEHEAKRHTVYWDATSDNGDKVSSGVYFYQLIGKDFVSSKKMLYIK